MKKNLVSVIVVTINRKQDLIKCLKSIQQSMYKYLELIVLDNGSLILVSSWAKELFPKINFIRSNQNLGIAGGRNIAMKFAKGDFLLFIDDDAQVDKNMISELIKVLKEEKNNGIVQPKLYFMEDRKILQGIGCDINLVTGRVSATGIRERDRGQYDYIREIPAIGCIWMIKRQVIKAIGGYDEDFFFHYEDPDFAFRARKAGFKVLFAPKALAWHRGSKSTYINPFIDYLGIRSVDSAYTVIRNKIMFIRKHARTDVFLIFLFLFLPLYILSHSFILLISLRFDLLCKYWQGFTYGLFYAISYTNKKYNFWLYEHTSNPS